MSEKLNRKALEQGLTEEQAAQSKQQYGTNALAKKETESSVLLTISGSRFSVLHWRLRLCLRSLA